MNEKIMVGKGKFADYLTQELTPFLREDSKLTIHLQPTYQETEIPSLRGFFSFGLGIVGPLLGCPHCGDRRRITASYDKVEMWQLRHEYTEPATWWEVTHLGQVIVSLYKEFLQTGTFRQKGKMYLQNAHTLEGQWHSLLPDSLCPFCSNIPIDTAESANIKLQSQPKKGRENFRTLDLSHIKNTLKKDYVDSKTGMINYLSSNKSAPFPEVVANLPLPFGDEGVVGRSHHTEASEAIAILEGLERYCGIHPRGKVPHVYDNWNNLRTKALYPPAVGVHDYQEEHFPYKPFHPDEKMKWVWGYSFLQEKPLLVPLELAYYSLGGGFVYETSNGCAIGGSLEEAILHGIFEVVERDAFLMTWYGSLELSPFSITDEHLLKMIKTIEKIGYEIHLFDATMEFGIPSIFAIGRNYSQDDRLHLICGAGAHLHVEKAVESALFEIAGMTHIKVNREKYLPMLKNSSLVKQMEDHSMLYGLPEAEGRLDFLLRNGKKAKPLPQASCHDDLKEDLLSVIQRFITHEMDVIVVKQTAPEIARNRLHCVKVLIPGSIPMTFGQHLRRVTGLPRLPDQINPYPHPFP